MIWLLAVAVWVCLVSGVVLALSKDVFRCVIGLALLGSAVNLLVFASGRLDLVAPPVVPLGDTVLANAANPLPQALVLTAIVIGFALVCFALVLMLRLVQQGNTDDAQALRLAEPVPDDVVKPPYTAADCDPVWPNGVSNASNGGRP